MFNDDWPLAMQCNIIRALFSSFWKRIFITSTVFNEKKKKKKIQVKENKIRIEIQDWNQLLWPTQCTAHSVVAQFHSDSSGVCISQIFLFSFLIAPRHRSQIHMTDTKAMT